MANPGKLIQKFSHNFSFPGWTSGKLIQYFFKIAISGALAGPISEKFIDQFFVSTSVFVKYGGIILDRLQKSACVMPQIIKLTIGWVFQKSVKLMPREFANKG